MTSSYTKGMWVLVSLKMWESFSYYGMQALLVLYLTQALGYTDYTALGLYALYAALVELTSVQGGVIGDRYGLLKCVSVGSTLIMFGHICLSIAGLPIHLGLGMIVVGTGLFRPNTAALLGNLYSSAQAAERESGFTLFYAALNLGGFLAGCLCGLAGETLGWHVGFGLAALGMAIGWGVFYHHKHVLKETTSKSSLSMTKASSMIAGSLVVVVGMLYYQEQSMLLTPLLLTACLIYIGYQVKDSTPAERKAMGIIALFTLLLALFYAIEEQIGSTMVLFASRHVDRELWGMTLPASTLVAINPFVIIIGGFIMARLSLPSSLGFSFSKVMIAISLQLTAFALLYTACSTNTQGEISLVTLITSLTCIGAAELFIGPTVWAICAQLSPSRFQGTLMGLVMLGYALGNVLAGQLSQLMAIEGVESVQASLGIYQDGFLVLCGISLGAMVAAYACKRGVGRGG